MSSLWQKNNESLDWISSDNLSLSSLFFNVLSSPPLVAIMGNAYTKSIDDEMDAF